MRATRRTTAEGDSNGVVLETTQMLLEIMETMRKHNEDRAEEIGRAQEKFRRESTRSREMLEQTLRDRDQFRARNEELQQQINQQMLDQQQINQQMLDQQQINQQMLDQQQINQQMLDQQGEEEEEPDFQPFSEEILF